MGYTTTSCLPYATTYTEGTSKDWGWQHLTFHMLPHTLRAHYKVNAKYIKRCISWKLRMFLRCSSVKHQNEDWKILCEVWIKDKTLTHQQQQSSHVLPMLKYVTQNDLCYDEVFGLMELSYLQCHIMLSSSKGIYIRIGPFSTISECNSDVPL